MSLVFAQDEFLQHVCRLIKQAHKLGFLLSGGDLWRTREQQQSYVLTGKSKTMDSMHLQRLAIDLNFFGLTDGAVVQVEAKASLQKIGDYWESLHPANQWGGNWPHFVDAAHFERRQ